MLLPILAAQAVELSARQTHLPLPQQPGRHLRFHDPYKYRSLAFRDP